MDGQAVIKFDGAENLNNFEAALFDAVGSPIANLPSNTGGFLLDRNGLVSGIYFMRVTQAGSGVATAKVIIK